MDRFFKELRRRNVFRVAGVYAVAAWLLTQVSALLEGSLGLPPWFDALVIALLAVGFPLAVLFAWMYELTPEGVKLTANVPESESIAPKTGKKLDFAILGGLLLAIGLVVADRLMPEAPASAAARAPGAGAEEPSSATGSSTQQATLSGPWQSDGVRKDAGAAPAASIAVLPFADLSPASDQAYFSEGIAEEILNVLARIDGLRVASRTSSFQFRKSEAGVPAIARELGVRHIVEGSVRKAGTTVRITAQLIDAETDAHLWSKTFDRPLTTENVFAIQDEIAREIVAALPEGMAKPNVARKADTENLDAYELYLKGHALFVARGKENLMEGMRALEEATRIDPGFARAHAALSAIYSVAPSWRILDRDYRPLAKNAADRALELNPDLSLPYAALGYATRIMIAEGGGTWEESLAHYDNAIARDPKNATAVFWRGIEYHSLGYFDRAIAAYESCLAIDPAYENCRRWMAKAHLCAGRVDEGLRIFEQGLEKGFFNQDNQFAEAYAARGNSAAALALLTESLSEYKPAISPLYRALTDPRFSEADRRAGLEIINAIPDLRNAEAEPFLWLKAYDQIPVYDRGQSLVWWFRGDPVFLKSKERKAIMRAWKLPDYWRKHGFPPQCKPVGKDDFECK